MEERIIYYLAGMAIGALVVGDLLTGAAAGAGTIAMIHLIMTHFFRD